MALVNYYGTGRRKTSVARVRLVPGEGNVIINNRWKNTASEYQKIQYVLDFINVWLVDNEVKLLLVEKNEEY